MQPIERYGVITLMLLVVTIFVVAMWKDEGQAGQDMDRQAARVPAAPTEADLRAQRAADAAKIAALEKASEKGDTETGTGPSPTWSIQIRATEASEFCRMEVGRNWRETWRREPIRRRSCENGQKTENDGITGQKREVR